MATTTAAKKTQPPSIARELDIEVEAAKHLLEQYRDILGDDAEAQADLVEGQTQLHEVVARGVHRIVVLDALLEGIGKAKSNLSTRAARFEMQQENLRTSLMIALEAARKPSLETASGTISLRSVPRQVDIIEEAMIPSQYWKPQEPKLDKHAVLDALKAGAVVPGAVLDNGGVTIAIRTK